MRLRTILCPTDFSDLSARQKDVAVQVAREFGARLVLHHDSALPSDSEEGELR